MGRRPARGPGLVWQGNTSKNGPCINCREFTPQLGMFNEFQQTLLDLIRYFSRLYSFICSQSSILQPKEVSAAKKKERRRKKKRCCIVACFIHFFCDTAAFGLFEVFLCSSLHVDINFDHTIKKWFVDYGKLKTGPNPIMSNDVK